MNLPPRKPDDSECCGNGCNRCVFDIYNEELKLWKNSLEQVSGSTPQVIQHDAYGTVKIEHVERVSHNSYLYTFASVDSGQPLLSLKVGQHVMLKGQLKEETICRQYTPINLGNDLKVIKILIKLYENGKMSEIIRQWKENDIVECRGPLGKEINYIANKWETVLLLAAGTGITPMMQIIQKIIDNEEEETKVVLLYACRTYEQILMKSELDAWSDNWNFTVTYYLSQEQKSDVDRIKLYKDVICCHRIGLGDIKSVMINVENMCAFVCGPYEFEVGMEILLEQCGFPIKRVKKF